MNDRRWARLARVGRLGIVVGAVWALSSGCLVQVLHLTTDAPVDVSWNQSCGRFKPQTDGNAIIGVSGVTTPDITIYAGVASVPEGDGPIGAIVGVVWIDGHGTPTAVGQLVAGTTYALVVSSDPTSTAYDIDVNTVLSIRDAQGNEVPVDCVN